MNQNIKNLIMNFLINQFPVKRIKNEKGKWQRVIIVNGGYTDSNKFVFKWNNKINENLSNKLTQIVALIFEYPNKLSKNIVDDYLYNIKI